MVKDTQDLLSISNHIRINSMDLLLLMLFRFVAIMLMTTSFYQCSEFYIHNHLQSSLLLIFTRLEIGRVNANPEIDKVIFFEKVYESAESAHEFSRKEEGNLQSNSFPIFYQLFERKRVTIYLHTR